MSTYARIVFYYVTQFLPAGAAHAYAGIWLAEHGLSGWEIGVVTTFPIVLILLSNVFVGRLADRARDWRSALQICSAAFVVFSIGLFWADSFWPILICFTGTNVAGALSAPIGDAAALHLSSKGRSHIGTLRGLATLGYMLALLATGYAAEHMGAQAFVIISLAFAVLRMIASLVLPKFKTDNDVNSTSPQRLGYKALFRPILFWPILSWALIYCAILVLNSFLSLHLKNLGFGTTMISWLIAAGALTEILMFFAFRKFEHLLDLRAFMLISGASSIFRWAIMSTEPSLPMLFALQLSHGVTYALGFVACISYISKNSSQQEAAEVQSFFNVVQLIAGVVFITGFSAVFDRYGALSFWLSAAISAIGTIILLWSMRSDQATGTH